MEIERKYYIDSEEIEEILPYLLEIGEAGMNQTREFRSIYWDTAGGALQKMKAAYRTRLEGDSFVATIKSKGEFVNGSFIRQEENLAIEESEMTRPDLRKFQSSELGRKMIDAVANQQLHEVMRVNVTRFSVDLRYGDSSIEVCVDEGEILAGDKSLDVSELEIELLSGTKEDLLQLGRVFEEKYGLIPATESKFVRGLKIVN